MQAISVQTITGITNRSEANRADTEGKSAQRGRFQRKHPGKPQRRSVNVMNLMKKTPRVKIRYS